MDVAWLWYGRGMVEVWTWCGRWHWSCMDVVWMTKCNHWELWWNVCYPREIVADLGVWYCFGIWILHTHTHTHTHRHTHTPSSDPQGEWRSGSFGQYMEWKSTRIMCVGDTPTLYAMFSNYAVNVYFTCMYRFYFRISCTSTIACGESIIAYDVWYVACYYSPVHYLHFCLWYVMISYSWTSHVSTD